MRKCGMQNLSVEAAEAISFGGDQRNNFENSVGGDPSARVTYDPLARKQPRKRIITNGRKQPKLRVGYSKVRIYFSGGDIVFNRHLTPKEVGGLFPTAYKMECLNQTGIVLMVLEVPKVLFGKIIK